MDNYKNALQVYCRDCAEHRNRSSLKRMAWVLAIAAVTGIIADLIWKSILFWELMAITCTVYFALLFFIDLSRELRLDENKNLRPEPLSPNGFSILWVGIIGTANVVILLSAALCLVFSHYFWYLSCVLLSFVIFCGLDYQYARGHKAFKKSREYTFLLFFVDAPAAAAFGIMLLYSGAVDLLTERTVSEQLLGGAIVFQMLLANLIFLLVQGNVINNLFATKVCENIREP